MHAFLSNLANRQTDKRIRAKTYTSSFVGGNNWLWLDIIGVSQSTAAVTDLIVPRPWQYALLLFVSLFVRPSRT